MNTEQEIPHAATDEVGREAAFLQGLHDAKGVRINPILMKMRFSRDFHNRRSIAPSLGDSPDNKIHSWFIQCFERVPTRQHKDALVEGVMSYLSNFYYQITGLQPESEQERVAVPRLVFLHGVMGFSANWRRIARAFESEFQVLVYDQRGHGRSFQPTTGYGPEDYAGDLKRILDELGWREIHLVGHSMGGRVAFHFASQYPERVTRLVIEDIGPSMYEVGASFILSLLDSVPVPFSDKRVAKEWFDREFIELYSHLPHRVGLAQFLFANLIENESKQAVWRFSEAGVRESIMQGRANERWDEVAALKCPTLLVRGQHSSDLPRQIYERVLATNSLIKGVEIPGAGHWVHSDQPELFIKALQEFFRGP